jgi:glycosyltransferase involved in cell wall biosynthesis
MKHGRRREAPSVLVVTEVFDVGGLETHVTGMVRALRAEGCAVHMAVGRHHPGQFPTELTSVIADLPFDGMAPVGELVASVDRLVEFVHANAVQIIHAHPFLSLLPALMVAERANVPLVLTLHGPASLHVSYGVLHNLIVKAAVLRSAARVYCVSPEVLALAQRFAAAEVCRLLPNGVDLERFAPAQPGAHWVILSRLDVPKVEGLKDFCRKATEIGLGPIDVVGGGPAEGTLAAHVQELGAADRFRFLGIRHDVDGWLGEYAAVAGMGRVALEAAAMNRPVVLVGYDGVKGLLDAELATAASRWNFSGRGLPTISTAAFAQQLGALATSPERFALRDWVGRDHDERKIWRRYLDDIASLTPVCTGMGRRLEEVLREHRDEPESYLRALPVAAALSDVCAETGRSDPQLASVPGSDLQALLREALIDGRRREAEHATAMAAVTARLNDTVQDMTAQATAASREVHRLTYEVASRDAAIEQAERTIAERTQALAENDERLTRETAERQALEHVIRRREKLRRQWEESVRWELEHARRSLRYRLGTVLASLREKPLTTIDRTVRWALGRYRARGWGLIEALQTWDPLANVQTALRTGGPSASPDDLDPLAIRLATVRARTAPWNGFTWEVPGLISIVLPILGRAERAAETIESVLAQTHQDVELIVVADGSHHDLGGRLAAYDGHPKVRMLRQPNQGLAKALSSGFELAGGEFWTWVSVGNVLEPNQLERQIAFLRAHPDAAMVYCDYLALDRHGVLLREVHLPRDPAGLATGGDNFIGPCFLYRGWVGRLLGDYTPIDGVLDYDYWLRLTSLFGVHHLGSDDPLHRSRLDTPNRDHEATLRVRRQDLLTAEERRQANFSRSWKIFVDAVCEVRLADTSTAPHLISSLDSKRDLSPWETEECILLVHPGTLEWLAQRVLPPDWLVVVWFDLDDPSPYRYGAELQRLARLCLVADSATAERCAIFTRTVMRATTPQAAVALATAFASNDHWTLRGVPDVDRARSLPEVVPFSPRPLRVLLEVGNFDVGGLERVVLDLATQLRREGVQVVIGVLGRPGRAATEAGRDGFEVVTVPELEREAVYQRLLTEREIDLVNAHFSILGARFAAQRGIPFVQTMHNTYVWFSPAEIALHQEADQHTTAYVCVSNAVAGDAEGRLGIPARKMVVISNGIDVGRVDAARLSARRVEERRALGWSASDFVVLSVASIAPPKTQLHLVRALAAASADVPRLRLALLGGVADEEYAERVKGEIQSLGTAHRIDLLGHHDDPQRFYFLADAFVLPSFIEGWSLALAEALYAGLPVLATDVGAARELLAQTGGRLMPSPLGPLGSVDAGSFAAAVRRDDPGLVRELTAELVALAGGAEVPVLTQQLAESVDREQALRGYTRLFRWLVSGGPPGGVRPAIWELHRSRPRQLAACTTATPQRHPTRGPQFEPVDRSLEEVAQRAQDGRRPLVFPRSIRWNTWLFQRPQQLARHFARRGYVTIYDDSACRAGFLGFREIERNLFLFRGDTDRLARLPEPLLWTFCYNYQLRDCFPARCPVLYDVIDHLSVHTETAQLNVVNHRRALREATLVAYVARELEELLTERPDRLYLPNGVDDAHFADPPLHIPFDREMRAILRAGKPIAAYYGALAQWFDYRLLEQTAKLRPDWNFVLIGQRYDDSVSGQTALELPNVHWLGPREYAVLPAYLRTFDVATIPFSINQVTRATSPLKLYEYFAGGKPVITTPMPECMTFPEVTIVRDPSEFAAALDPARRRGQDPAFQAQLRRIAHQNSWAERVRAVERAWATLADRLGASADEPPRQADVLPAE